MRKLKGDSSKASEDIAPKCRQILRTFVFFFLGGGGGAKSRTERKRKSERRVGRKQLLRARLLSGLSLLTESLGQAG